MSRPKGSKNKPKEQPEVSVEKTEEPMTVKEVTEVLNEIEESIEPEEEEVETDTVIVADEEVVELVGPRCSKCIHWVKTRHNRPLPGYRSCLYSTQNHYVKTIGTRNYNGFALVKEDYVPEVHEDCKGFSVIE